MRKTTLLILLTALLGLPLSAAAQATDPAPVRVFILAGQSNMEGKGVVSYDDPRDYNGGTGNLVWSMEHSASAQQMAHLRDAQGNWVVRDDVTISYTVNNTPRVGGLTVGYTNFGGASHIGPELQFGHVVGDAIDEDVFLIKTAWGGKSLFVDFRPPSAEGDTGPYYTQMVAEVREALELLDDRAYEISGFIWMQGWNDMVDQDATAQYADNLVLLARDIRAEFELPNLPIVIGELGNGGAVRPDSGMARFRVQQQAGAQRIEGAVFVPTQGFARPAEMSPNQGHGHHWFGNAESYFLVGDALGHAAVQTLSDE